MYKNLLEKINDLWVSKKFDLEAQKIFYEKIAIASRVEPVVKKGFN